MIKKLVALLVINLLLFSTPIYALTGSGQIAATSTAANTEVGGRHLIIANQGANEVFITIGQSGSDAATAATTHFRLDTDEGIGLDASEGQYFTNVGTICSASETATVVYIWWD